MESRRFNSTIGDRIARKIDNPKKPTKDFSEAIIYARRRAERTGTRQMLRKHSKHGWWQVLVLGKK